MDWDVVQNIWLLTGVVVFLGGGVTAINIGCLLLDEWASKKWAAVAFAAAPVSFLLFSLCFGALVA